VPHQIVPTPGSPEAVLQGCLCPPLDNALGRGILNPGASRPVFVVEPLCPLHGNPDWLEVKP